jgi:hypothetical protein
MVYKEFIDNILNSRGRFGCKDGYYERHHIKPRCLGGSNDEDNLIDLYAKEHFIAHKLLADENPDNVKIVWAYTMMSRIKGNDNQQHYKLTPEEYEEAKIAHRNAMTGEKNPMYGKRHTQEARLKMSENHADISGKNNPWYGVYGEGHPAYGVHRSEETKAKISQALSGENHYFYGKHHSEETKRKISDAISGKNHPLYGKPCSDERKQKISQAMMGKMIGSNNPASISIYCYELDEYFDCMADASTKYNINKSSLSECLNRKQKSAGKHPITGEKLHWVRIENK